MLTVLEFTDYNIIQTTCNSNRSSFLIRLTVFGEHKVSGFVSTFEEYLSKLLALWPWNWLDSIEYVGYTWAIVYFSFSLIKLSMMDEREMLR